MYLKVYYIIMLPLFILTFRDCFAALDINLNQLKYLADHLSITECKHLVASLHYKQYEFPKTLGNAVMRLNPDDSCLELLEKWNNGDGKTESHSILTTRLQQMDHNDLSLWLSSSIFKQLTQRLEDAINGEEPEDSDLQVNQEVTTETPRINTTIEVTHNDGNVSNDDDLDELILAEVLGGILAAVLILYGCYKLLCRRCCREDHTATVTFS